MNPPSTTDLAAILIGVASDKNLPITDETVIALNLIMDLGLDATGVAALVDLAETARNGVLTGRG